MASTLADQATLADNQKFQARVRQAMIAGCLTVANEAVTVAHHASRAAYVAAVMESPQVYVARFANAVATQSAVIEAATGGVAGAMDGAANKDTQQALATDAQIATAVGAVFNAFIRA